jgi:hypothetical protein
MYIFSRGVNCYSLSLAECEICSSISISGCFIWCNEFGEQDWWNPVVVEEVSVGDVDNNSYGSNSCIFWESEFVGNTGGDVGEFVGRYITIICGGVLLMRGERREARG